MKMILKYIAVLLIIISFSNCKDDITTPADTTKYYSVSGIVFDVVSNDYSPGLKKGAPIYLNNDSTTSGTDGRFLFNKVSKGNHIIKVTLTNYEPFSTSILVSKDTSIAIYLYGKKEDYFPIQENSQKKFKYYDYWTNLISSSTSKGEAIWDIYTPQMSGSTKIYSAKETLIFTNTFNGSGGTTVKLDTVITPFEIRQDQFNNINITLSIINGFSFNRYQRITLGEIITLTQNGATMRGVSLKKNVGLYKIQTFGDRGINTTYELIE